MPSALIDKPDTDWPGLHLVKLAGPKSRPVLRLVVELDADVAITSFRLENLPDADPDDAAHVAIMLGAGARTLVPEPQLEPIQFLAVAAAEALHLVYHAYTDRHPGRYDWRQGYRTALEDLRKSSELQILRDRTADVQKLLKLASALGMGRGERTGG